MLEQFVCFICTVVAGSQTKQTFLGTSVAGCENRIGKIGTVN